MLTSHLTSAFRGLSRRQVRDGARLSFEATHLQRERNVLPTSETDL